MFFNNWDIKIMKNTYVIGDLHGNYRGLLQAIERSRFNPKEDTLISLGDLVDGGPESAQVIEYLSNVPDCILVKSNHDEWFTEYLDTGIHPTGWLQGGFWTIKSYIEFLKDKSDTEINIHNGYNQYITNLNPSDIPEKHIKFMKSAHLYYIDDNNNLYVHGGFDRNLSVRNQVDKAIYYWDRNLWSQALSTRNSQSKLKMVDDFNKIFIGHTTTQFWKKDTPMEASDIINLDTGAGNDTGKVTIYNVNTHEYWQSDKRIDLYEGKKF